MALKGIKHETEMGPDGIPVAVWKILGEEGVDNVFGSAPGDFRAGENARGMEGQYDCTNLQREGGIHDCGNYRSINMISHTVKIWEGNNRQKTDGGEKHRRSYTIIVGPYHVILRCAHVPPYMNTPMLQIKVL